MRHIETMENRRMMSVTAPSDFQLTTPDSLQLTTPDRITIPSSNPKVEVAGGDVSGYVTVGGDKPIESLSLGNPGPWLAAIGG